MRTASALLLVVALASAHISLIHPSVYDKELYDDTNKDANGNSDPLENYNFDKWWWHGNLNYPPKARPDSVFELPANGKAKAYICNSRTFTPYGWPERMFPNPEGITEPFSSSPYVQWNNIHTNNRSDVAGCALGIAYKSDRFAVVPEDFVIFSVAHDCPARWLQTFEIPNLPSCPNGMCQCAWFWVHKSYGGTDQMYMTPFQCKVTNAASNAKPVDVARARAPRKCWDSSTCVMGPRNPMYWMNNERNNMHEPHLYAPTYSTLYGFAEGAQKDIFVDTNTVNYTPRPFPANQRCGDRPSRLVSGSSFGQNDYMVSPNCQYQAWISGDGKLVLGSADRNTVNWDSGMYGLPNIQGTFTTSVNADGTIRVTNNNNQDKWVSPMTKGVGIAPYRLELTNAGQLIFFDATGTNLWESFWTDNREQSWVTPFNPDPPIWKTFKPSGQNNTNGGSSGGSTGGSSSGSSSTGGSSTGAILVGTDLGGNDYNQTTASNYQDCQSKCNSASQCNAWSFDTCGNRCWLKTAASQGNGDNCRTSGTKSSNNGGSGSSSAVMVGKDLNGGDYRQDTAANYQGCQSKCNSEQQCKAWAFDTCGSTCWLKSAVPSPSDGGSCRTSGIKQ